MATSSSVRGSTAPTVAPDLLSKACKTGDLDYVLNVIQRGAKPDSQIFTWACLSKNIEIIGAVVSTGAQPDNETLTAACSTHQLAIVKMALLQGAKPNARTMEIATASGVEDIIRLVTNINLSGQEIKPAITAQSKLASIAFGKAQWEKYFGDVGVEPPLPGNIDQILNSPCPFWPGKIVAETHVLTLIPKTVNGQPLTLDSLGELIQHPKQGTAMRYSSYEEEVQEECGNMSVENSHWVLMTRDVIPNSRNKSYEDQKKLIAKAGNGYTVPAILDATASILMAYFAKGWQLYPNTPEITYTLCQEMVWEYQTACGSLTSEGLDLQLGVHYYHLDGGFVDEPDNGNGIGASRKL